MLRSMNELKDYAIRATDGNIGHVKDFYFDDQQWVVRYLIVDTGGWLSSRKVLISPISIGEPNWRERVLPVSITKEQVKNSPDIDTDMPVSRQHEMEYLGYYGYPNYWGGTGLWGAEAYPGLAMGGFADLIVPPLDLTLEEKNIHAQAEEARHRHDDPHLRSCKATIDYRIEATDGDIGHVRGLLVDEETWAIRYMIVATGNWWLGHDVLIAPQWIREIRWIDSAVSVSLARQIVKDAPPYDPLVPLDREQEILIFKHYGHAGYWTNEVRRDKILSSN